jgi:hypothetical protein
MAVWAGIVRSHLFNGSSTGFRNAFSKDTFLDELRGLLAMESTSGWFVASRRAPFECRRRGRVSRRGAFAEI